MTDVQRHEYGYAADKEALVRRLHRIEGQVRGIERMLEQELACEDGPVQLALRENALSHGT